MAFFAIYILVLFILLLVYIRKTNELSKQVQKMTEEMHSLRNALNSLQPASTTPAPAGPKTEMAAPAIASPIPPPSQPPTITPATTPPLFSATAKPSRTRAEWEALIGGKLLNRIGAFALILGVGFFLKYAFDNNLISETMRVVIGFVAGAILLLGGARFHKKNLAIFAQGLIGAGIAILYLAVYASFNFYHLVSQPVAVVLMSLVTALTFFQALKYDSLAVAVLGWAGGFLTPILLSTGQSNEIGLFTYLALLDLGLLAIVFKKEAWTILEPLTLAATYVLYGIWNETYYTESNLLLTVFFLTIFWGLFYGLDVLRLLKGSTAFSRLRQGVAAFNAFFYFVALYAIIDESHHQWMSIVTLGLGAIYFLTFLWLQQRQAAAATALTHFVLTAIILLAIATAIQFSGFITVACWAVEALVIVWCSVRWNMRYVRHAALALLGLAVVKLIFTESAFGYSPLENFKLLFNQRALAFVALAVAAGLSAILFNRLEEKSARQVKMALHAAWGILLFVLLTIEVNDYFRQQLAAVTGGSETATSLKYNRFLMWAAIWTIYSLPLVWLGLRARILSLVGAGLGVLGCAIITIAIQGITFVPITQFTFGLNWRAAVFIAVLAGVVVHTLWLNEHRRDQRWINDALGLLQVAVVLLLLDLLTGETRDIFKKAIFSLEQLPRNPEISAAITRLQDQQQLVLSGVWLLYSVLLMVVGIWRRLQGLRVIAIVLFGITILKIFVYDLSFLAGLPRIFSFIGLGVILLLVSYLYQRYKAVIFDSATSK
ncbi:MAG: hypothetical protein ALAOOOJD_03026 [bacterium]|nr:hypothetical protein [bacterium]